MTDDIDTFRFERELLSHGIEPVAGVDEAGRGPLAGPVVAGCVVLDPSTDTTVYRDSKALTARQRDRLFQVLHDGSSLIGVGSVDAREIEQCNIHQASLLAMQRAVLECSRRLGRQPAFLLVDGRFEVPLALAQQALIKGESKSASIAAASIVAKVTRDRIMARLHEQYPVYNFIRNQGYPTREHREAIARFGPCPLHRRTFKGVVEYMDRQGSDAAQEQGTLWPR